MCEWTWENWTSVGAHVCHHHFDKAILDRIMKMKMLGKNRVWLLTIAVRVSVT